MVAVHGWNAGHVALASQKVGPSNGANRLPVQRFVKVNFFKIAAIPGCGAPDGTSAVGI